MRRKRRWGSARPVILSVTFVLFVTHIRSFSTFRSLIQIHPKIPRYAMGSQKVPGKAVLHSCGRRYVNGHLIAFKVLPLCASVRKRAHTHALSILLLFEAPAEGFLWIHPELGRPFPFHALDGCDTCLLWSHFQSREQPKSLEARSGECGGWVKTGMYFLSRDW
jgi:hypothetical protein